MDDFFPCQVLIEHGQQGLGKGKLLGDISFIIIARTGYADRGLFYTMRTHFFCTSRQKAVGLASIRAISSGV